MKAVNDRERHDNIAAILKTILKDGVAATGDYRERLTQVALAYGAAFHADLQACGEASIAPGQWRELSDVAQLIRIYDKNLSGGQGHEGLAIQKVDNGS